MSELGYFQIQNGAAAWGHQEETIVFLVWGPWGAMNFWNGKRRLRCLFSGTMGLFYCLYFDSHVSLAQSILDVWTLMLVTGAEHNSYHFVLRTGIQVEVSFQHYSWSRSRVFGDITSIPSKWGFQPSGVWHDLARSLTPLCETGYVTHLLRAWISPCGNWGV